MSTVLTWHTSINHEDRLTQLIFVRATIRRCELAHSSMWSRLTAGCSTCHRVISHHGQDKAELAVHTKQSTVLIVSPPQKESLRAAWRSADPKQGGRNLSCAKTTTLAVWDCKERLVAGCRLQLQDLQAGGEGKGSNEPARTNGHPPTHPSTVRPSGGHTTTLSTTARNFVPWACVAPASLPPKMFRGRCFRAFARPH